MATKACRVCGISKILQKFPRNLGNNLLRDDTCLNCIRVQATQAQLLKNSPDMQDSRFDKYRKKLESNQEKYRDKT